MNTVARATAADVTVVIPTLGGPLLSGCVESIARGTVWPARVVVVDQSGASATPEWMARLRMQGMDIVHVLATPAGISAATNLGLRQARTRFVAVTHDDCLVRSDWLERMAAGLAGAGEAILTGRVEPAGEGIVLTVKTDPLPATFTRPRLTGDVLFPPNMGFALGVLDRVGWFDEHPSLATAGEDNEWAHRALRRGVAITYDPTIVVDHLARHGPADLPGLYRRYAHGHGAFYGTWLRRADPLIAVRAGRDLLRAPWLLIRGLLTRNRELVSMGRGELTGLLPGILQGLRNRGVRP